MLRTTLATRCAAPAAPSVYRTTWGVANSFGLEGTDAIAAMLARITQDPKSGEQLFNGVEFCAGTFFPFLGEEEAAARALIQTRNRAIVQIHTCGYPVPPAFHLAHVQSAAAYGRRTMQPAWKEHADSLRFHAEDMAVRLRVPEGLDDEARKHPELSGSVVGSNESKHPLIACINCHGGKDSLPRDDALKFLEEACIIERDVGIPICHETHRQRILHDPFVLAALRDDLPSALKLNCDLAHYVVALERVMSDDHDAEFWPELLREVIARRAYLLHCRVGLPQSPQLQDPRPAQASLAAGLELEGYTPTAEASEATEEEVGAMSAHLRWWTEITSSMRERGVQVRAVPEYGPAPYQTRGTEEDLDAICVDAGRFLSRTL